MQDMQFTVSPVNDGFLKSFKDKNPSKKMLKLFLNRKDLKLTNLSKLCAGHANIDFYILLI